MRNAGVGHWLLAMTWLLALGCSRSSPHNVTDPVTEPSTTTTVPPTPPAPENEGVADLEIISINVTRAIPHDTWNTHEIAVTVRNNGSASARGFDCVCDYACSAGQNQNGAATVVQSGFIAAHSTNTYRAPLHIYCAGPPAFLDLKVTVDSRSRVPESNESNNTRHQRVTIP